MPPVERLHYLIVQNPVEQGKVDHHAARLVDWSLHRDGAAVIVGVAGSIAHRSEELAILRLGPVGTIQPMQRAELDGSGERDGHETKVRRRSSVPPAARRLRSTRWSARR